MAYVVLETYVRNRRLTPIIVTLPKVILYRGNTRVGSIARSRDIAYRCTTDARL